MQVRIHDFVKEGAHKITRQAKEKKQNKTNPLPPPKKSHHIFGTFLLNILQNSLTSQKQTNEQTKQTEKR